MIILCGSIVHIYGLGSMHLILCLQYLFFTFAFLPYCNFWILYDKFKIILKNGNSSLSKKI